MTDLSKVASAFLSIFESHCLDDPNLTVDSLSIEDAYRVQQMVIDERISRGQRAVGYKVGCTSAASRRQFGLDEPIWGRIMAPHVHHGDSVLRWSDFCQPAVEPELVLTIGRELGDEVADDEPLDQAIDSVSPGIEIHNFRFWFGSPTMQELVASNGIHAALVIGRQKVRPENQVSVV